MNTKANLLLAGSGLLLGLTGKSGKTKAKLPNIRGSQNTRLPEVPLQVVNSPFSTKETIGAVDRWMNKLEIPKQQKLVMQKSLRYLPTDAKGRITKDQIEQLFAKGMIPYRVQILHDKLRTSNDEINETHMEEQFQATIKSFLSDFEESPWNISPSEQIGLLHRLFGDILNAHHDEIDDNLFTEALYDYGLDSMRNWFQNEANKQGWSEEIDALFADKMADFVYHLKEVRVLAIRGGGRKETKYSMYSILKNIKHEDAEDIEAIVYPKLEEMLQDSFIADSYSSVLSTHYRNALFWFRGFILDDILYIQELQSDHASAYKKPLTQRLKGMLDSPLNKTKLKHDITRDDAFWWFNNFGTRTYSVNQPSIPSRFQVPPTDWVRSDILLTFAVAASLGLNKVAFCDATASLIAVGGKEKGQKYFYDKFVPEKVKSVAKKYGIIQEEIITLPFKNNSRLNTRSIKCQSWKMPDNLMRFFREQGYPIFG